MSAVNPKHPARCVCSMCLYLAAIAEDAEPAAPSEGPTPALPVPAQEAEAEDLDLVADYLDPDNGPYLDGDDAKALANRLHNLAARLRSPSEIPEAPCPKCAQREARMFPIMDGPDVPWSLLEPHEKHAMKNHGQTLERLAERGGLAAVEALQILDAKPFGSVKLTVDYANRILAARVRSLRSSDSSRSDTDNG